MQAEIGRFVAKSVDNQGMIWYTCSCKESVPNQGNSRTIRAVRVSEFNSVFVLKIETPER